AVRVIFADHVADHPGAFLVACRGIELEQPHRPQEAPVNRLQPVAQVGQRARSDRRKRVDEIALGESVVERRVDDGIENVAHADALAGPIPGRERLVSRYDIQYHTSTEGVDRWR